MFQHVGEKVMPWLRGLANDDSAAGGMSAVARDATFVIPSASLLAEAVGGLNELHVTDRNVDVQGDIYEYMLSHLQVAGALGQFRTPRHIIRAMVALVDPKLGETVIDPACGTGGFLIAAHQHVLAAGTSPEFITYDEAGAPQHLLGDRYGEAQWKVLRDPPLYGADVDQTFVRIATMTLQLRSCLHRSSDSSCADRGRAGLATVSGFGVRGWQRGRLTARLALFVGEQQGGDQRCGREGEGVPVGVGEGVGEWVGDA